MDSGLKVATVGLGEQLGGYCPCPVDPGGHSGYNWRVLRDSQEVRLPRFAGGLPVEGEGKADVKDGSGLGILMAVIAVDPGWEGRRRGQPGDSLKKISGCRYVQATCKEAGGSLGLSLRWLWGLRATSESSGLCGH